MKKRTGNVCPIPEKRGEASVPINPLSSSGSESSYLRLLGKRQLFRAQTQGQYINDLGEIPCL